MLTLATLVAAGRPTSFVPSPATAVPATAAPLRRRGLLAAGLLSAGLGVASSPAAAASKQVTEQDLQRIADGYKDLVYLMNNWNKETRDCTEVQTNIQRTLTSGTQSPDECKATPDIVRKYMGTRSINEKLFNTQQLWIDIETQDLVPAKEDDRFSEAVEDFEKHKRQASEWAYTSSWGSANPGGGRDKVEDYLLRSKSEAALATESLGVIVDILKLA